MKKQIYFILLSCLCLTACSDDDQNNSSNPQNGELVELGDNLSGRSITAAFQSAVYLNNSILVATDKGIMRFDLGTNQWSQSGLEDLEILSLYQNPVTSRIFAGVKSDYTSTLKTLYLSDDSGSNWYEADEVIYDNLDNRYENYLSFAVHPDNPENIFANLEGGATIAISTDGGLNWNRNNYSEESNFGYGSYIAFMPSDANTLYQGSENPLDDAWLGTYEISANDPVLLENFAKVLTMEDWGNRRPNEIKSFDFLPNTLFIGQEGALSKVTGSDFEYIYLAGNEEEPNGGEDLPYSYISAIWVDPEDTDHILFGGFVNSDVQPMSLYETWDAGDTIYRVEDKFGMANPKVMEILDTTSFPIVVLTDTESMEIKLAEWHF